MPSMPPDGYALANEPKGFVLHAEPGFYARAGYKPPPQRRLAVLLLAGQMISSSLIEHAAAARLRIDALDNQEEN
jgi:hypothetical protein